MCVVSWGFRLESFMRHTVSKLSVTPHTHALWHWLRNYSSASSLSFSLLPVACVSDPCRRVSQHGFACVLLRFTRATRWESVYVCVSLFPRVSLCFMAFQASFFLFVFLALCEMHHVEANPPTVLVIMYFQFYDDSVRRFLKISLYAILYVCDIISFTLIWHSRHIFQT